MMDSLAVYIGVAIGLIILVAGAVSYTDGRTDKPAQVVRSLYAVVWIACVVYGIGMVLRAGRVVISGMPALTPLVTLEQLSAQ